MMTLRTALFTSLCLVAPLAAVAGDSGLDTSSPEVARWDDTRWFIQSSLELPTSMTFQAKRNAEFSTSTLRIESVQSCEIAYALGKKRLEVDCTIEDIGLQAVPNYDPRTMDTDKAMDRMTGVLNELDETLTGAVVQLQVHKDGRVMHVDLEGVTSSSQRERQIEATLRSLMARSFAAMDLQSDAVERVDGGEWIEKNPLLMAMPSATATMGSTRVEHTVTSLGDAMQVDSSGYGSIVVSQGTDLPFDCEFQGVALFDGDRGFMTERAWSLTATPTATAELQTLYRHEGFATFLEADQSVEVSPTGPLMDDLSMYDTGY